MADKDNTHPRDKDGRISVLLEMRADPGASPTLGAQMARDLGDGALRLDNEFAPVPMTDTGSGGMSGDVGSFILRGTVADEDELKKLQSDPKVMRVWKDTPIEPFAGKKGSKDADASMRPRIEENAGMGPCPIGTCDCDPNTARGTIADVARYLGVDQIWSRGIRGSGIVVGIVDSGITAQGRPVKTGETSDRIARVIGGWPTADWGTESGRWGNHGNMCATDVLGMAPEAQLYDLRIAAPGGIATTISRAIQAYQWAIDRFRMDGTPHVLSNSWGIFQESWDAVYARDPNHPFTRKVVEAIDLGIIVLFAAGNCGDTCPDGRCGPDVGTGRSIWGANGHEKVMTVGAVNIHEQFVGYSSRGPASLHPQKPDFCSITHFRGYYPDADSGTSAATPILAGVCALFKQAKPTRTQAQMKADLIATCKDIGPAGFDVDSGHGIVRPKAAYDRMMNVLKWVGSDTPIIRDQIITPIIRDQLGTPVTLDRPNTPIIPDRIGTPIIQDRPGTPVVLDNPRTPILPDQIGTKPVLDQPGTPLLADQGGTPILADQGGTPPLADQGGTVIGENGGFPPIDPPGGGITSRATAPWMDIDPYKDVPFVLSTEHHAPDWKSFEDMLSGAGGDLEQAVAELVAQIDQTQAVLEALIGQYQALMASGGQTGSWA